MAKPDGVPQGLETKGERSMKCRHCKRAANPGRTMCRKHLKRLSEYVRVRKERWADEGRCYDCGQPKDTETVRCKECSDKTSVRLKAEYRRKHGCGLCRRKGHARKDHQAMGLCRTCPAAVVGGFPDQCATCEERRAKREQRKARNMIRERRRAKVCIRCKSPKLATTTRCEPCRVYVNAKFLESKATRAAAA